MLAEQWVQTAERLLRELRGEDLRLRPTHEFRTARVARCSIEHSARDGGTVIVKVPHIGGDGYRGLRSLHNEQAALELLGEVHPGSSPRLLAADPSLGVLVLEDLGDGPSLATYLLDHDGEAARVAAIRSAAALGAMHAATAGHADRFYGLRRKLSDVDWEADRLNLRGMDMGERFRRLSALLRDHLLPEPHGADDELAAILDELAEPGPFLALSSGDPCPDNGRITTDRVQFFDFEAGAFRHALADAAHYLVPFPNCWCWRRLPEEVAGEMEAAYRTELAIGCPATCDDERYNHALAAVVGAWFVWTLHRRLPHAADDFLMRARTVTALHNFISVASRAPTLSRLVAWADQLQSAWQQRWPEAMTPADTYPAFGGRPFE